MEEAERASLVVEEASRASEQRERFRMMGRGDTLSATLEVSLLPFRSWNFSIFSVLFSHFLQLQFLLIFQPEIQVTGYMVSNQSSTQHIALLFELRIASIHE